MSFQEGAALGDENCVLIVRVSGVNGRCVLQDVFSSLSFPAHYVLVSRLKGPPMNQAAVPRSLARVYLQQSITGFRSVIACIGFPVFTGLFAHPYED